jgi:hypothetical protein
MFSAATPEELGAAQFLTGFVMAVFVACGVVPGLRRYSMQIRAATLGIYLVGIVAFTAYALLR